MGTRTKIGFLGFVNYKDHPTQKAYKVFNFMSKEESDLFAQLLEREKIKFEHDTDETENGTVYLFGVKNESFNRAQRANFEVSAKFKKPLITNSILRYGLLIFFLSMLTIAIIGYVKS